MRPTKIFYPFIFALTLCLTTACSDDDRFDFGALPEEGGTPDSKPDVPENTGRDEIYRPQVHYTPAANWMNDPNGLVYANGTYHLFYQYNPMGNDWGNMSWGHATSTDLIHWTEQKVAMTRDDLGDIFSGCCVVDKNNTAGFGKDAIVAVYTSSGERQQQSIAYSTDNGMTFTKYEGNPVIANTSMPDFRDPKVFWHEETGKWIMTLATGWSHTIELWCSTDLKAWSKLSVFSTDNVRCNAGQWECPDLVRMDYNGQEKWVLIVSTNPGGPVIGSGTMYFTGSFDGTAFTADAAEYPLWLDYGMDNYAGVTWSNMPDGRTVYIGWMNNWQYAGGVPASPWRSAMTLPRRLTLTEYEGKPLLASTVVNEIDGIAGEWSESTDGITGADAYQLKVKARLDGNSSITLSNASGESYTININAATRKMIAGRGSNTGKYAFSTAFAISMLSAPLNTQADEVTLDIYVDKSSVEIITGNGSSAMTNIVFPASTYTTVQTSGAVVNVMARRLDCAFAKQ